MPSQNFPVNAGSGRAFSLGQPCRSILTFVFAAYFVCHCMFDVSSDLNFHERGRRVRLSPTCNARLTTGDRRAETARSFRLYQVRARRQEIAMLRIAANVLVVGAPSWRHLPRTNRHRIALTTSRSRGNFPGLPRAAHLPNHVQDQDA